MTPFKKGEDHDNAKLTEEEVREIRRLAARGIKKTAIAIQFNTTKQNINWIHHRRSWKHVQ